jgi:hypothetical protein
MDEFVLDPHQKDTAPMMGCGHAANGVRAGSGEPVCIICFGIMPGATVVVTAPDLEGRTARCTYGDHADVPSSTSLAFFAHRPSAAFDNYYCGCFGWD